MCPSGSKNNTNFKMEGSTSSSSSTISISALSAASANSSDMAATAAARPILFGRSSSSSSTRMMNNFPSMVRRRYNNNNPMNKNNCNKEDDDEKETSCRFCGSYSLMVDWKQGDKVCTTCGVVAEERMLDDRPEWRDFNDAEDLIKGAPAAARCGMIPVDESKYLGGLQPTSLTKVPFGGQTGPTTNSSNGSAARVAMVRKRLLSTNRKLDRMMGQRHAKALKNARVSRLVRKRQLADGGDVTDTDLDSVVTAADDDVRPEIEQILIQEEEDANRMQTALNSDKWSLQRAILLFGQHESTIDGGIRGSSSLAEVADLEKRLDRKLRQASSDLYQAYQMLLDAARRLQLPDRVIHEATDNLCRYVARRDGFPVKGVSSRLTLKKDNLSASQRKQAADTLREHNKAKQMGSLCAALLLLTARKLGWPRPLVEVCGAVEPTMTSSPKTNSKIDTPTTTTSFIKPKHCSRAMDEVKVTLPDFARTLVTATAAAAASSATNTNTNYNTNNPADDPLSTINFVDHSVRKLRLPPVAEASIRALVWQCAQEQKATGQNSGTKLSTLCASLTYFLCLAGSVMQQLASQAQAREKHKDNRRSRKSRFVFTTTNWKSNAKKNSMGPPPSKLPKLIHVNNNKEVQARVVSSTDSDVIEGIDDGDDEGKNDNKNETGSSKDGNDDEFDVFSHKVDKELLIQKKEYEMRRVWDTWAEQTAWLRSLSEIEHSSGVSSQTILSHYKSNIYPHRQKLLESLRDAVTVGESNSTSASGSDNEVDRNIRGEGGGDSISPKDTHTAEPLTNMLTETPLASVLLSHVIAAAPLLDPSGKQVSFGSSR